MELRTLAVELATWVSLASAAATSIGCLRVPLPDDLGMQLSYGIAEEELGAYWSHRIILIVDNAHVLMGGAEDVPENRVMVSREEPLIEVVRSNLVLDCTLYGERTGTDTADVVEKLTAPLAPVEELVANSLTGPASEIP